MKVSTKRRERDRRGARRRPRRHRGDDGLEHARGQAAPPRAELDAPARATAKALGIQEFDDDRRAGPLQRPLALGLRHRLGRRARAARRDRPAAPRRRPPPTAPRSGAARQVTLPALEVAPPFVFWGAEEVAIDVFHHAVYAAATGLAYELISAGRRNGGR